LENEFGERRPFKKAILERKMCLESRESREKALKLKKEKGVLKKAYK
jgi:hypothetical protein